MLIVEDWRNVDRAAPAAGGAAGAAAALTSSGAPVSTPSVPSPAMLGSTIGSARAALLGDVTGAAALTAGSSPVKRYFEVQFNPSSLTLDAHVNHVSHQDTQNDQQTNSQATFSEDVYKRQDQKGVRRTQRRTLRSHDGDDHHRLQRNALCGSATVSYTHLEAVQGVMNAVDATRRANVFTTLESVMNTFTQELPRIEDSEEAAGSSPDTELQSAANDSLSNVQTSLIEYQGKMMDAGTTVMSNLQYEYSQSLIEHAQADNHAACDTDVYKIQAPG